MRREDKLSRDPKSTAVFRQIKRRFPEFESVFTKPEDVYTMLAEFARFIKDQLDDEPGTAKRLQYVTEVYERGSEEINYFIWVNMFEKWAGDVTVRDIIRAGLSGSAQAAFQEASRAHDAQPRIR